MKKKLLNIILLILFFTKLSLAQIHFGGTMLGATVGIRHFSESDDFITSTKFGGFILSRLAIGPQVEIGKNKTPSTPSNPNSSQYNRFGFGPFARFYFKNTSQIQLFGESSWAFSKTYGNRLTPNGYEYILLDNAQSFTAGAGLNIFFTRKLAAELAFGYNLFKINNLPTREYFVFKFGVAGFFGGSCSDGAFY
jgi:hypothetical protein